MPCIHVLIIHYFACATIHSQQKKKEDNALANCDKDICAEADRLDVKEKAPLILAEILLDENILKQLKQYKLHFLRVSVVLYGQRSVLFLQDVTLPNLGFVYFDTFFFLLICFIVLCLFVCLCLWLFVVSVG